MRLLSRRRLNADSYRNGCRPQLWTKVDEEIVDTGKDCFNCLVQHASGHRLREYRSPASQRRKHVSRSSLRIVILLSALVTGLVHLVLLSIQLGGPSPIFILNGLGYLVLLALFWFNPSFLGGRRTLLHYAFMAYTAITTLLWSATGTRDLTGYLTKADEVVLFVALWADLRAEKVAILA